MSQDYNEYLAINVLNEQQLVSYRTLSRALKVHSNLAKQMLYDFHHKQNAKKPSSVHATYLLTGLRRVNTSSASSVAATNGVHSQDGEDTVMQSSPPLLPSSSAPNPDDSVNNTHTIRSILLVKEEHLEQAKSTFEAISTIHIYSLQANGLSDIQTLAECNRKIAASYASEDPLQARKQYGTIQNSNVKRRTARTAPPPPAPVVKDAEAKTKPFATAAKSTEAQMKAETKQAPSKPTPEPEKKGIMPKPAQAKRQNSDIFKSFAKGATIAKAKEDSKSSAENSPAPEIDNELMTGFSDDDPLDEEDALPEQEPAAPAGKSKKEREAELQAMMEQEDEPMEDAPTPVPEVEEPNTAIDKAEPAAENEPKETVTVENGRRRGKRRVMKKKTVKDEDGYLVTKEEAVWESFSEDEPEPKRIKVPPAASMNAGGNKPAAGKKGGKAGQGNIMSFFAKK